MNHLDAMAAQLSKSTRVGDLSSQAMSMNAPRAGGQPRRLRSPRGADLCCENATSLRKAPPYCGLSWVRPLTSAPPNVFGLTIRGSFERLDVIEDLSVQPRLGPVGDARQRSVHPTFVRLNRSLWSVRPLAKAADPMEKFPQLPEMEPRSL